MKATTNIDDTATRQSKYCQAIAVLLQERGHASNAEILMALRESYPEVSATTVHRATARMAHRGEIALAPSDTSGAMRYDTTTIPHDHFHCTHCGLLRDTDVVERVAAILEESLEGCQLSGRIIIGGICISCKKGTGV